MKKIGKKKTLKKILWKMLFSFKHGGEKYYLKRELLKFKDASNYSGI